MRAGLLRRIEDWSDRCPYWALGLVARVIGLRHKLAGHRVRWRHGADLWTGTLGWIDCIECPETEADIDGRHCDASIWVRQSRLVAFLGRVACGLLGHPGFQHPKQLDRFAGKRGVPTEDPDDVGEDGNMVYLADEWSCIRCLYRMTLHATWADARERGRS